MEVEPWIMLNVKYDELKEKHKEMLKTIAKITEHAIKTRKLVNTGTSILKNHHCQIDNICDCIEEVRARFDAKYAECHDIQNKIVVEPDRKKWRAGQLKPSAAQPIEL